MKRKAILAMAPLMFLASCAVDDSDTPTYTTRAASQDLKNQIAYDVCDKRYNDRMGVTWAEWMKTCIPFVQQ